MQRKKVETHATAEKNLLIQTSESNLNLEAEAQNGAMSLCMCYSLSLQNLLSQLERRLQRKLLEKHTLHSEMYAWQLIHNHSRQDSPASLLIRSL